MRLLPVYLAVTIITIVGFSALRFSVDIQKELLQDQDQWLNQQMDVFGPPMQFPNDQWMPENQNAIPDPAQVAPQPRREQRLPGQP